jgi:hypothetical protein
MVFEETEEVEFIDAENYVPQPKGAVSYEQIVLEQVKRCVVEGSQEMTGGYWKEMNTRHGIKEQYIPDQRQIYIQAIKSLHDVLMSFFDEEMIKFMEKFNEEIEAIRDEKITMLKEKFIKTDDMRIKHALQMQINAGYIDPDSAEAKQSIDETLDAYRILFQQLLLLFSRKRYLIAQAIDDSIR